ncbi:MULTISPECIES: ATP-binding cassette domain-containing protein [Amycolatopsis]|uniref:Daunorubicin ABC transporter ATPase n=1 Tax=Amycolatopsis bullii TaxID=941987 RepID=A0ABQ3KF48_9PSEU|nr:ATP-binding cassette domain-containing protein [Amycolatopsis bullii]GHG20884.1 daunorubicin ABC transporter ATPase [Amycolatopsis bullii]
MTEFAIEVDRLSKSFGTVHALDEVSLTVPKGSVCGLLGHNGAGKTTLVNMLSTLLLPTGGAATVAGFDIVREGAQVRRRIGLTGQFASVDENLTGFHNLVLIARLLGASKRDARARADELLEVMGLVEAGKRYAKTYSGGMRRRLDLAASLVGRPELIFLDEPTTGLDPSARITMWQLVKRLVREGTTVLLTTQLLDEAEQLADSITLLSQGKVVVSGTPAELKARVGTRTVTITLASEADIPAATTALLDVGLPPQIAGGDTDEDAETELSVPAESPADLARVVRALDDADVTPRRLALVEPRLDDVYLAFTHTAPNAA